MPATEEIVAMCNQIRTVVHAQRPENEPREIIIGGNAAKEREEQDKTGRRHTADPKRLQHAHFDSEVTARA